MANNTVTPEQPCDPDSGKCRCLPNWEGERCYVDVDECQRGLHDCDVTRAICHNVPGGFQCTDRQAVVLDKNDGMWSDCGFRWFFTQLDIYHHKIMSHISRKRVFGDFGPGKTQTGLLSYRS